MLIEDPLWYKDVVVYQVHVKAFFDSNDDGTGDFPGLLQKLDYIQDLGVTAIWLLPFYPSPLRDDGYDIADYRNVNPTYGTTRDVRNVIREAHRRGLRVITELVINHTSDQHPWFQRARRAKPGSGYRDWYVWSDTVHKYQETRIIFTDTEASNWTWDPVANAYYWHRFFSHQPDLNFDNPQVFKAIVNTMRVWLDYGVDGLRLDAIPYLCERDGTNNENLPETHAVIKRLRAELDKSHAGRVFLAEANQWPEDVQHYFGDGDECHMAYHFPLMPRMYMAIAQEDRHPITDIMRQTPEIPEACQWAIFLRNHDELTLEMVTDSERDYLWSTYAAEKRARINLGIRRRLAPLMDNDRRKIELMNSLLMSMPGTPFLYYGDEIGMGDNVFLGDRNGVRTPMQWTPDRNGGFSRADPASLYLPTLMGPVYGYQAINVEGQSRDASSLLNWMKRLIRVRQARKVFGRGTLRFLYPRNRSALAYLREFEGETILCVANLSRSAQAVELDLQEFRGKLPVELMGRSVFPPIRDDYYMLTVQGYGFFWFHLADPAELGAPGQAAPEPLPEYVTLVFGDGWQALSSGRSKGIFERDVLPGYLPKQRWYGAKDIVAREMEIVVAPVLAQEQKSWLLAILETRFGGDAPAQRYQLPLAVQWTEIHQLPQAVRPFALAKVRRGSREGVLYDACGDEDIVLALVDRVRRDASFDVADGSIRCWPTSALARHAAPEAPKARPLGLEQTNTTVIIEDWLVLKFYRRLHRGIQPEVEMGHYLTEVAGFANSPAMLGAVEMVDRNGDTTAMAILHAMVRNQGDGWTHAGHYLERFLDEWLLLPAEESAARIDPHAVYLEQVRQLGRRTAELHRALCPAKSTPAFAPEPIAQKDLTAWTRRVRTEATAALAGLRSQRRTLAPEAQRAADILLARRSDLLKRIDSQLPARIKAVKTRHHGDYHLGQVLIAQNDFYIIDFEGEPRRSFAERRRKDSPLKDVAGMVRSFDYVAWVAADRVALNNPERRADLQQQALAWRDLAVDAFLSAYRETMGDCPAYPADETAARGLLALFTLEKLFYEIGYELANRPAWVGIPLAGAIDLLFPEARKRGEADVAI